MSNNNDNFCPGRVWMAESITGIPVEGWCKTKLVVKTLSTRSNPFLSYLWRQQWKRHSIHCIFPLPLIIIIYLFNLQFYILHINITGNACGAYWRWRRVNTIEIDSRWTSAQKHTITSHAEPPRSFRHYLLTRTRRRNNSCDADRSVAGAKLKFRRNNVSHKCIALELLAWIVNDFAYKWLTDR